MSEWQDFYLEDLAEIHNNKRVPLSSMQRANKKGIYPYYGASGIVDYIDEYAFDGEYVLISEDGENLKSRNTPIAFKATGKFWVNNHAHIVKGKKDFHNDLIIHYFRNLDLNEFITGAVQPKLNKASLTSIPFYLPSEEAEQKAIASVLSSLDDKIDLLHRQNTTLERMAETLFRQWFVEEALEGWEEKPLSFYGEIVCGKTPSKQNHSFFNGNVPFIKIPDMHGNPFIFKTEDTLTELGKSSQNNKTVPPYSICVSCIATVGLVSITTKLSQTNQQINTIIPKQSKYRYFLYLTMKASYDLLHAEASGGTATLNLNTGNFSRIAVPLPPDSLLLEFETIVDKVFNKIYQNQAQIQTLEKLRDSLLPKLMSGEVRVDLVS